MKNTFDLVLQVRLYNYNKYFIAALFAKLNVGRHTIGL